MGDPSKNEKILAHCSTLANLFPLPTPEDERKVLIARRLTDPDTLAWEIWKKQPPAPLEFCGLLLLTDVVPKLDATAHFVIFDRQLVGKRPLIQRWLAWCFEQLELQRISVEIPEHLDPLIRFARKFGFRYEGEVEASHSPLVKRLESLGINEPAKWVSRWGARKEHMHDDGGQWRAVVLLRLLREEAPMR